MRITFFRGLLPLCGDNSAKESRSADADSKSYDLNHAETFG